MASSDDEFEDQPEFVSDYQFVDENDEPISFSVLPIQWSSDGILGGKKNQVFVRGTTDGGLQKMYKPVLAWRFDLSPMNPKISVLSKDNHWITLQKPKKSFECIIRTALVTVNCLHLVKKNPEMSDKLLWSQLSKLFSLLEPRPSVNDLIDHMKLIEEACRRDKSLSKSKFITTILEERPQKKKVVEEDGPHQMKGFIVDDDVASDDDSDGDQLFDSVCAICDNGGRITPCDGMCMRSFHTSPEDADKDAEEDGLENVSICDSLGYSKKEIQDKAIFTCKNCSYKQHQCFSCGSLGSSDKVLGIAEVFQCVSATCGYFFHPRCVAKLLYPDDQAAAEELSKSVAAGESFACPSHNCDVCHQLEDHKVDGMQFAVCRRCPTSYHRNCLPRGISFEASEDTEQRAWENLLHINNRILIYCLKHEIDPDLGTPIRDHLKFPGEAWKKPTTSSALLMENSKLKSDKRSVVPEIKKLKQVGPGVSTGKSSKLVQGGRINEKNSPRSTVLSKRKGDGVDASSSKQPVKKLARKKKAVNFSLGENEKSLGMQLWEESGKTVKTVPGQYVFKLEDDLGPDSKKWVEDLIKKADSVINLESIYEKSNKQLSTHAMSQKALLESFTQGRVDGLVQAIHAALKKLDARCNVKDIQAVCAPSVLPQIAKWKNKLRVYIAPFLHGNRYTSFGRHFTKPDKLKEIVEKIHWYVEDGDMVVDFCCGANEFSCLMKDKLEQTGKKCSYKNFDLFRPKNDFCFERRDWMTVKPSELPSGSKLVMGLNPPFGVNSALANQFINQALKFKPKLIVLIVPPETERLDRKTPPYDLVWEDFEKLSGLSFYLPGSIDINDKQLEDWNVIPPVLYLWSRSDWTSKFRGIAEKHGHTSGMQSMIERNHETVVPIESMEVIAEDSDMDISHDTQEPVQVKKLEGIIENAANSTKDCMEQSLKRKTDDEIHAVNGGVRAESTKKSQEKQHRMKYIAGKGELYPPVGKDHQRLDRPSAQRKPNHLPAGERTGKGEVGDGHHMHERPSIKPHSTKTDHSPASAVALSRSPPESHLLVKGRSPFARESTNIGSDQFEGPGFSRPGYRNRPEYRPGSRSPLKDQLLVKEKLPLARDSINIGTDKFQEPGFSRPSYQHRTVHRLGPSNSPADGIVFSRSPLEDQFIEEPGFPRSGSQQRPGYCPRPRSYPEGRYHIENESPHYNGYENSHYNGWATGGRHPLDHAQGYMEDTFGQQPSNREMGSWYNLPPSNFGPEPSSYGHASMSAMERYAPRLDELNNERRSNMGAPDLQPRPGHGGMYNHQAPRPPYGGFAPGPRPPTSHQRSGGWLYE